MNVHFQDSIDKNRLASDDEPVGAIVAIGNGLLEGWIFYRDRTSAESTDIWLFVDGKPVVCESVDRKVHGSQPTEDRPNGLQYEFAIAMPDSLAKGRIYEVDVRVAEDDEPIVGTRRRIRIDDDGERFVDTRVEGKLLRLKGLAVEGWAYDTAGVADSLELEVLDGEKVVARGSSSLKVDIRDVPEMSGFRIPLPVGLFDGRWLDLRIRDAGTGTEIDRTGFSYEPGPHPGFAVTRFELENRNIRITLGVDFIPADAELSLDLWVDGVLADRFTISSQDAVEGEVDITRKMPGLLRNGDGASAVFDGESHQFALTPAKQSYVIGSFDSVTEAGTAAELLRLIRAIKIHDFEKLPRSCQAMIGDLAKSALFDVDWLSIRTRKSFEKDEFAVLAYIHERASWLYPTSAWVDIGFVKKQMADQWGKVNPLEWYLSQGSFADVGPNPMFSNADYCLQVGLDTESEPERLSFFDDWIESLSSEIPHNPSMLVDVAYISSCTLGTEVFDGDAVADHLKAWIAKPPAQRSVDGLGPYFDQDWLEQCFVLRHNKPKGCLLSAFRFGNLSDQSPHPVLQVAGKRRDYYQLIRSYESLFIGSGIDDIESVCSKIDEERFYTAYPRQSRDSADQESSCLRRYLSTDKEQRQSSFMKDLDDEFIRQELPGLIEFSVEQRGIGDPNYIWCRWLRLLGLPGRYEDSLRSEKGSLTLQNLADMRRFKPRPDRGSTVDFIIPTYGRDDLVIRCMLSALQSGDVSQVNFIIAEDAVQTDSGWILKYFFSYADIYSNEKNLGFLLSCTAAVQRSNSDVILLVNNDVIVHERALEEMLETFASRDDAAVVGGLVLNADGTIQENGGMLWRDASAWNYHRNLERDKEFALNVREADYVSGCWIGIRRTVWDSLGGFDKRYVPAYYEESDFCLGCWQHGYKVFVNPQSVVTHLDGATMGQDVNDTSTLKSYQKTNLQKFYKKWSSTLTRFYNENGKPTAFHTGRSNPKRFITVVFDHYIPEPDRDAGSRTMMVVCKALANIPNNYVLFIPANANRSDYAKQLEKLGIEVVAGTDGWKRFDELLKDHAHLVRYAFVSRISVAEQFSWHINQLNCRKSIYIHDIEALRGFNYDPEAPGHEKMVAAAMDRYAEDHKAVFDMFDDIISLSEEETALLKPYFGKMLVDIFPYDFPNLVDHGAKHDPKDLIFVGSYNHPPNKEAIVYFMENVWPSLTRKLPDANLHLCGSGFETAETLLGEKVILHGRVTDRTLRYLYSISRVSIAPLLSGAGMKGKVIESCSLGVPCVGTHVAWQGIELPERFAYLSGSIGSFIKRTITAYESYSEETAASLRVLNEGLSSSQRLDEVIPRLVRS